MNSKSSTTAKLYYFGDVFMRCCIILSVVLSNLAMQTTMVSADTGADTIQEEQIFNSGYANMDHSIEVGEKTSSIVEVSYSETGLQENNTLFEKSMDSFRMNAQHIWSELMDLAQNEIERNQTSSENELGNKVLGDITNSLDETPYIYYETPNQYINNLKLENAQTNSIEYMVGEQFPERLFYKVNTVDISSYPECTIDSYNNGEEDVVEIVVDEGETCRLVPGEYTLTNLSVSGTLYFETTNYYDETSGDYYSDYVHIITDTAEVTETGHISADGQGYASGEGPGAADDGDATSSPGGAGFAGYGSDGDLPGGDAYFGRFGDADNHLLIAGSGGGGPDGGAGGGIVYITVSENEYFYIYGTISANGMSGSNYSGDMYSGGGAGGTVLIDGGMIYGSGYVTSIGGDSADICNGVNCGGGGSGGQVLLDTYVTYFVSGNTHGTTSAVGGIGKDDKYGATGYVYFASGSYDQHLVIDSKNTDAEETVLYPEAMYSSGITIKNYGLLQGAKLLIPSTLVEEGEGDSTENPCVFSEDSITGDNTGELITECVLYSNLDVIVDGFDWTIKNDSLYNQNGNLFDQLLINAGSTVTLVPQVGNDVFTMKAYEVTVENGAVLRLSDANNSLLFTMGRSEAGEVEGEEGGEEESGESGEGEEGGVLIINGTLSANGKNEQNGSSIEINANSIAGTGSIQANGGSGELFGNGGEIIINGDYSEYSGGTQTYGGEYGDYAGNPGIVIFNETEKLFVDNHGNSGSYTFNEGTYVFDRIELGNAVEVIFAGENGQLTVNEGVYGTGTDTPILTIEGDLNDPESFIIDNVILNWSGVSDFQYSVDISKSEIVGNGSDSATITFNLMDSEGTPLSRDDVAIRVSGDGNIVNGVAVSDNTWVNISESGISGTYITDLASTGLGTKNIQFKVGNRLFETVYTLDCVEETYIQILLDGETADPEAANGKTGEIKPIYTGDPTHITFRVVDGDFVLQETVNGTAAITLDDGGAQYPQSMSISNGIGEAYIIWSAIGEHSISVSGEGDLSSITGNETTTAINLLTIADGETYYMDEVRTYLTSDVSSGESTITVADATGLYPGHRILLLKMTGDDAGENEMFTVENVTGNQIELETTISFSYLTSSGVTQVLLIPRVENITVQSGGLLTVNGWDGNTGGVLYVDVVSLLLENNAMIDANGKGYPQQTGPGTSSNVLGVSTTGGGYGGQGTFGGSNTGIGQVYGSLYEPIMLGSGGGNPGGVDYAFTEGGSGGGIIRINAETIENNGIISVNGGDGSAIEVSGNGYPGFGSGGSGGSIWLSANELAGNGEILSIGGRSGVIWSTNYGGSSGAGGRIAIEVLLNQYSGIVSAYTGTSRYNSGAGSIYLKNENKLIVDNNNISSSNYTKSGLVSGIYNLNSIELKNKGSLLISGADSILDISSGDITGDGTVELITNGDLIVNGPLNVSGYSLNAIGKLTGATSLVIDANERVDLYNQTSIYSGAYSISYVEVGQDATLALHTKDDGDGDYTNDLAFELNSDNVSVADGGLITLDGFGYLPVSRSTGNGPGGGEGGISYDYAVGGSHGGLAGETPDGLISAEIYGSFNNPVTFGSAGGSRYNSDGGNGGGALHLVVNNTLNLAGTISANGFQASSNFGYGGGGAGGSIWIEASEVIGVGSMEATGGSSSKSSGGGGGRISIISNTVDPSIEFDVLGGSAPGEGEHGTIYLGDIDYGASTIVADPTEVAIGGVAASDVLVSIVTVNGHSLPYTDIDITLIDGSTVLINGDPLLINQTISLSETDLAGEIHFDVSATTFGTREIVVSVDGTEFDDHIVIDFTAGDFKPEFSTITSEPINVPADGVSVATITATANNEDRQPVMDVEVTLTADGDAVVVQPTDPTDEYGQAIGYVSDETIENVTVSAYGWGMPFLNPVIVNFYGTDFVSALNTPIRAISGQEIQIGVTVQNLESYDVDNVEVSLTLPDLISYDSDDSGITPVVNGQVYTWTVAEMAADQTIDFIVNATISGAAVDGDVLSLSLSSSSAVTEIDPDNNTTDATITIVQGYSFDSSITPSNRTLYIGGEVLYTIEVENTDILPDIYTISTTGLDAFTVALSDSELAVNSGASKKAILTVGIDGCISETSANFNVIITSNQSGIEQVIPATLTLNSSPKIILQAPANNSTSGSQSVLFSWRTDPETTGTLYIYPTDDPEAVQTYTSESGLAHSIQVDNLTRNTSYTWYVDVTSACGTNTSVERVLNIGNGIVFSNHNQNISINRDYDQRINVTVQNTDTNPHTLTSSVINPYEDLIVNFVDSGSVDQTITLQPGETANLTLALHAQDAELHDYVLTANLIADEDTTPIIDNANLNVEVLFEGDYTIAEDVAAYDPVSLAHTYVITNHGQAITDLSLEAIDPNTGLPASVYVTPSLDHAKLETGESIRVVVYPLFDEEDAINHIAYSPTFRVAKANLDAQSDIPFSIHLKAAGIEKMISGISACDGGRGIYTIVKDDCQMTFSSGNWYCTNRPVVTTKFFIPAFLKQSVISSLSVSMRFSPQSEAKEHDGSILFNGEEVAKFEDLLPDGSYTFDVPVEIWNEAIAGTVNQDVTIESLHKNAGHYIVSNEFDINIGVDNAITFVCAASQEEADLVADIMYPCGATAYFNPETDVFDNSVLSLGEIKKLIKSVGESLGYEVNVSVCTQGECGDPIDSRTGVFSFASPDISFPTSVGTLGFQRTYSTGAVEQYAEVGYGWTHNHAERLIFPDSMYGMEDYMIFRDYLGNQHLFKIEGDGTYKPGPGVLAELSEISDGYMVTTADGYVLTFNNIGMATSLADAQGNAFTYTYDGEGVLQRVSADNGTRYLDFAYNDDVRIESVTDHTGRQVSFEYDEDGNLIRSTDLLDQEWTYEYDENHLMTALNDPTGLETVVTEYDMLGRAFKQFDAEGNLMVKIIYHEDGSVTVEDADGYSETHQYDSRGIMIDETDQVDRGTDTNYDANFRPTTITNEIGSTLTMEWSEDGKQLLAEVDPAGNRTEYTYDENGNLTSTTDPSGNTKSYTYDGDLLTSSTDIEGKTTTYTYTAEGWLETQTDHYGRTTTYTYNEHGQRLTTTDWLGTTTGNTYDELGRQIESVDEQGRVNRNEYNAAGQLVKSIRNYDETRPQNEENIYNLTTTYTYDVFGNQQSVTDTLGNTIFYKYDSNGRLILTIDALGNENVNTYDANGQLVKSTNALGRETTYVYDAAGRRLSTVNALGISSGTTTFNLTNNSSTASDSEGNAATYYYNELNQVVRIVDPMGHETTTTYNENGNVETKTDELGRTTTYEYDDLNRLVKTTDASRAVTQTVYDENGYRVASIDALGNQTTYAYDDMGRVVQTTDPLGHTTSSDYDEDGKLVSTTDAMGRTTTYTYDEWDRKASMTDGAGRTTTYTYDGLDRVISTSGPTGVTYTSYDALGRVVSRTDARGHTTTTTYDDLGRVKTTTDYQGNTTTNYYDQVGNLLSSVDSQGTTSFEYDVLNRQVAVTDPLGNRTQTVYDNLGNVSDTINAKGVVTHYVYDSLQRNVAIIQNYKPGEEADADTNVRVDYTYNAVGNRTYVNDANGHITEFQYDAANRVTKKIDPIGNTWNYVYDLAGNLTSRTDGNGVTTSFVYDDGGNLLTIDYPDGEADVSFTYNNAGQRVSMTDGIGTTTWRYDNLGRVESVNDAYDNEIVYTYDEYGNRTGLQYADGKQVAYDFDSSNRLVEVASWDSLETEYDYNALGQLTSILRPNGVESTYEYDELGRLTFLEHNKDVTNLANYTYTYDEVGNIIHAEENVMGGGSYGPTVQVTVVDTTGEPLEGNTVYAYSGDEFSNYSKVTDEKGQVSITLPDGTYRFRVDVDGTQFWSGESDHCEIGACGQVTMTIPEAVLVTVIDSNSNVLAGQTVYAYEGETYSKFSGETDENGQASLRLPEGEYRFRTTLNSTPFWSATLEDEQCVVPGCTVDEILVTVPLLVTVQNDLGDPMVDLNVYAYDDATYAKVFGRTDENGQVELTLPEGEYRFRADYNGTQFWSAAANHCAIPGCSEAAVTVSLPVTVTVADTGGGLISGVNVYAFDEATYQNFSKRTDENGEAVFNLPGGNYRFRADYNGTQFWSGTENTCEIPGCTADAVTVTQPVTVTVLDSNGAPQDGLNVYAFDGSTYKSYSKKTDINGEAIFTLPLGDYRFRADLNGTLFWSGTENTCSLPDCGSDQVSVTIPVEVMVLNGADAAASVNVYAFNGTTYSGYSRTTGSDGVAIFTLPEGEYRFRADYAGEQIFSAVVNHCAIPGCELVSIQVGSESTQTPTLIPTETFTETPTPEFTETYTFTPVQTTEVVGTYTPTPQYTNTPVPDYTNTPLPQYTDTPIPVETHTPEPVDADTPLPQYSSTPSQTPTLLGASEPDSGFSHIQAKINLAPLADDTGVSVTVMDSDGTPQSGLNVYAFDGSTFSGSHAVTNDSGIASFTLAEGSYHFRADLNGTRFWSGEDNTCTTPSCVNDSITVTKPLTITVVDSDGSAQSGLNVYAFNGTTYAGYSKATNESGEAVFTLPEGAYRFRADFNGTRFWSAEENHCTLPGCESTSISVTKPLTVTVRNSDGAAQAGLNVYAFDGTTYAGYSKVTNENGEAVFTLPAGDYHFRADMNGTRFWSADENHCTLPGCENVDVSVTVPLSVSVVDTDGTPQSGIAVYAFNGTTFMNFSKTTDENGLAVFTLPQGDYRFRADAGGTYYWSSEENDCTLPGCTATTVTTSKPVTVSVVDSYGAAMSGVNVYAFDGTTYAGYSKVSDEYGNAVFYLPAGDYRFRADREGTQFWSSEENACTLPGCENVIISVTLSVTVNVTDTDGTPVEGLNVYAFNGETYSNYSQVTDENGQAIFSLPEGDYHFRADLNGTQFWSADENTCTLPGCVTDSVIVTKPLTVTVAGEEGNPYADLNVYVFDGETYAGYSGKTDAGGHVTFTLPQGEYHFRADYDGVQFWSSNENTCTIPGCEEDAVTLPGGTGEQEVSIDYTYDALNRLISAEYSNGTAFGYTYDAAGNILTYAETHYGQTKVTTYTYDAANQLLSASESDTVWYYTYDGNGSLIQTNPGTEVANGSTRYTYNTAGYLTKVENYTTEWQTQSEMTYDGLGNRLEVTTYTDGEGNTTHYVLDGGAELTAIGAENSTYYLYGLGAIGTLGESWSYMLQDGAGSTRQLVDEEGAVALSVSYTPWGDTMEVYGSGMLNLGYLGGVYDAGTGLIYMGNGQYYDPSTGRFLTRGAQQGQSNPYTPWNSDPAGMLIAPLALLALVFGRKKTRTKFDQFVILFVIVVSVGLSVSACTVPQNSTTGSRVPEPPYETDIPETEIPPQPDVPEVVTSTPMPGNSDGTIQAPIAKPVETPEMDDCNTPYNVDDDYWLFGNGTYYMSQGSNVSVYEQIKLSFLVDDLQNEYVSYTEIILTTLVGIPGIALGAALEAPALTLGYFLFLMGFEFTTGWLDELRPQTFKKMGQTAYNLQRTDGDSYDPVTIVIVEPTYIRYQVFDWVWYEKTHYTAVVFELQDTNKAYIMWVRNEYKEEIYRYFDNMPERFERWNAEQEAQGIYY